MAKRPYKITSKLVKPCKCRSRERHDLTGYFLPSKNDNDHSGVITVSAQATAAECLDLHYSQVK